MSRHEAPRPSLASTQLALYIKKLQVSKDNIPPGVLEFLRVARLTGDSLLSQRERGRR